MKSEYFADIWCEGNENNPGTEQEHLIEKDCTGTETRIETEKFYVKKLTKES